MALWEQNAGTACLKDKIECKFFLACIAGVSVRFRCKERGMRVKDCMKMAQVKPKITFLGHSLLRNHREMLAMQAKFFQALQQ